MDKEGYQTIIILSANPRLYTNYYVSIIQPFAEELTHQQCKHRKRYALGQFKLQICVDNTLEPRCNEIQGTAQILRQKCYNKVSLFFSLDIPRGNSYHISRL